MCRRSDGVDRWRHYTAKRYDNINIEFLKILAYRKTKFLIISRSQLDLNVPDRRIDRRYHAEMVYICGSINIQIYSVSFLQHG